MQPLPCAKQATYSSRHFRRSPLDGFGHHLSGVPCKRGHYSIRVRTPVAGATKQSPQREQTIRIASSYIEGCDDDVVETNFQRQRPSTNRPARPPICFTSDVVSARCSRPSNLDRAEKTTRRMLRLRPMPTASVATKTSVLCNVG